MKQKRKQIKREEHSDTFLHSIPPTDIIESNQNRSGKSNRKIYKADYGDATPEEVAKAVLNYRR